MFRNPVVSGACFVFALSLCPQDLPPATGCDEEIVRLATSGASGYCRREPSDGDVCCEGFFVKKVSRLSADVQLEPVDCILMTRALDPGQSVVRLAWEYGAGVSSLRGVALALAEGTDHPGYRLDALEDSPGIPDARAPEREHFNWNVRLLVEHGMTLGDVGLIVWSHESTGPVPRRSLRPLVVNGPRVSDAAAGEEDLRARIQLKLRATEGLRSNDLQGFWVRTGPEGEEFERRPAVFRSQASRRLVITTVELPPDGNVWTLYVTVVLKHGAEINSLPQDPIQVAVPSAAFLRWSRTGVQ